MDFVETTISEHIFNQGHAKGEREGERRGERRGELKGQIEILEKLYADGILQEKQFKEMIMPLRKQLKALKTDSEK
jgi:flagellar biosynthesis/type III secretory pathway protein FliH